MKTAQEVIEAISKQAAKNPTHIRRFATMNAGEWVRQGDIYVERLDESEPTGDPVQERQLAPGTTKGSRHVIAPSVECDVYGREGELTGPMVIARSRLLIEHPEHAHLDLPPGCYSVTYQRDYARERADEIRRVAD